MWMQNFNKHAFVEIQQQAREFSKTNEHVQTAFSSLVQTGDEHWAQPRHV